MLLIPWTENYEVLRKLSTKKLFVLRLRNIPFTLLGHILKKEGLAKLTLTGKTEVKRVTSRKLPDDHEATE